MRCYYFISFNKFYLNSRLRKIITKKIIFFFFPVSFFILAKLKSFKPKIPCNSKNVRLSLLLQLLYLSKLLYTFYAYIIITFYIKITVKYCEENSKKLKTEKLPKSLKGYFFKPEFLLFNRFSVKYAPV